MLAVVGSGSGEQQVLATLYRRHAPQLFGVLYGRCGDRHVAEELLAQTFENAAAHFTSGRGDEVTGAWLMTVAKRRLVDHWRRRTRGRDLVTRLAGHLDERSDDHIDPELWAAVDSLAPNQRAVLVLRYVDDWSVDEIADGLDLSYPAAESLLARARRSLRVALERQGFA